MTTFDFRQPFGLVSVRSASGLRSSQQTVDSRAGKWPVSDRGGKVSHGE